MLFRSDTTEKTGVGDIGIYCGWAYTYQNTQVLDFIDTELKIGVLIPSGETRNEDCAFDIPLGHDNHVGIPISFSSSFGVYDWLTIGGHVSTVVFFNNTDHIRMKTDKDQNGFIKLAHGEAFINRGVTLQTGGYIKADHFFKGFSALFGYSFAKKHHDTVDPCDTKFFSRNIVSDDCRFKKWSMHTIHLMTEYDFSQLESRWGPRIGITYDRNIGGENIFKTNVVSGFFGVDIAWDFN